jgi:mRNA interferase MazF
VEIRHGFLYLADLNPRIGSEAGKIRPVVVIQTDLLNQAHHPSTWILPCTSKLTGDSLLRVELPTGMAGNKENCEVMIDQNRAIDNRRFKKELKPLPLSILKEIKEKIRLLGDL